MGIYVRGLQTGTIHYFSICEMGMFSLNVNLCDDDDSGWEC